MSALENDGCTNVKVATLNADRTFQRLDELDRTDGNTWWTGFSDQDPSQDLYSAIRVMYDITNAVFWDSRHAAPMFTMNSRAAGHFTPNRWERSDGTIVDEIGFNGRYIREQDGRWFLITLLHEQVHQEQAAASTAGKRGYHNQAFVDDAERIGLKTINLGAGKSLEKGYRVTSEMITGGLAEQLYDWLVRRGFEVTWGHASRQIDGKDSQGTNAEDRTIVEATAKKASKTKFTCSSCGLNAWAKPSAKLRCDDCNRLMQRKGTQTLPVRAGSNQC